MVYAAITPIEKEEGMSQTEFDQLDNAVFQEEPNSPDIEPLPMNPLDDLASTQESDTNQTKEKTDLNQPEEATLKEEKSEKIDYFYTVRKGDTFLGIANRFGFSFDELQEMNPGVKPSNILVGVTKVKVKVKAVYIVGPGDILSKISEKFGVSKEVLMRTNQKKQDIALRGEEIIVPIK